MSLNGVHFSRIDSVLFHLNRGNHTPPIGTCYSNPQSNLYNVASPSRSLKYARSLVEDLLVPGDEVHGGRLEPPFDLPLDVPSSPSLFGIRYGSNSMAGPRENPILPSAQQNERIQLTAACGNR